MQYIFKYLLNSCFFKYLQKPFPWKQIFTYKHLFSKKKFFNCLNKLSAIRMQQTLDWLTASLTSMHFLKHQIEDAMTLTLNTRGDSLSHTQLKDRNDHFITSSPAYRKTYPSADLQTTWCTLCPAKSSMRSFFFFFFQIDILLNLTPYQNTSHSHELGTFNEKSCHRQSQWVVKIRKVTYYNKYSIQYCNKKVSVYQIWSLGDTGYLTD